MNVMALTLVRPGGACAASGWPRIRGGTDGQPHG